MHTGTSRFAYYVHGPQGLICRKHGIATEYFHYDYRGSTLATTDQNQVITHGYRYEHDGRLMEEYGQNYDALYPMVFLYVGKWGVQKDVDELYYMRARYLHRATGKFTTEDPVWNENLYKYVLNNSIQYIDPLGNSIKDKMVRDLNKTVDNTWQALLYYFFGNGEPVNIGPNTIDVIVRSKVFKSKDEKIKAGKTSRLEGNFSINLENKVFHIGHTNVDYKISCLSDKCIVTYSLFSKDGFWDVDFIDEKTLGSIGIGKFKPDGLGPNLERFGGTPYPYIPVFIEYSFTNPGY